MSVRVGDYRSLEPPTPAPNDVQADGTRDLGRGLPGRFGTPHAALLSDAAGEPAQLRLTSVAPGAPVTLVLGVAPADLPFKGGTLVPTPDLLVGLLHADLDGQLGLPAARLAELPGSLVLYLQFWVLDPSGPQGFSASNALMLLAG